MLKQQQIEDTARTAITISNLKLTIENQKKEIEILKLKNPGSKSSANILVPEEIVGIKSPKIQRGNNKIKSSAKKGDLSAKRGGVKKIIASTSGSKHENSISTGRLSVKAKISKKPKSGRSSSRKKGKKKTDTSK